VLLEAGELAAAVGAAGIAQLAEDAAIADHAAAVTDQADAAAALAVAQAPLNELIAAVATAETNLAAADAVVDLEAGERAAATAFSDAADTAAADAETAFAGLITAGGLEISADGSILIEHRSADIGLSPPNSGWMTLFGQFFDHGLDLLTKGGNGTVYVPLQPDDPLYVEGSHTNFMALTRATPFINPLTGLPTETQNTTTPFVDQNQTYTSHASHQVFLREYAVNAAGHAVSTGKMLDGAGGIGNWGEVKAQAVEMLGLKLSDFDVHDVPLLRTDAYGKFVPGTNGYAQVTVNVSVVNATTGALISNVGNVFVEGVAGGLDLANLSAASLPSTFTLPALGTGQVFKVATVGTGHAFLNDIAHHAAPGIFDDRIPGTPNVRQVADSDIDVDGDGIYEPGDGDVLTDVNQDGSINGADFVADDRRGATYDNEMLDAHFITGDGRGNENIGLTAVHFVFHAEHNRLVDANKDTIIASGDLDVINEWLLTPLTGPIPTSAEGLNWNGERLFQAARFVTEMQYQHMVFEEFARRIQPNIDPFVFTNSADLDPAIVAEFAHTVYRFGHSMLTDTVDRFDAFLGVVDDPGVAGEQQIGLIQAFLNPQAFAASGTNVEEAAGAIIRGMSRQVGNEMDEFIVEALRNNLVGLPLDLAVLNIARGRDTGVPKLNDAREQLYDMTNAVQVKPYTSWFDFAQNIKHPLSIVNFIAAYGTHPLIAAESTLEGKRAAAIAIVLGTDQEVPANPAMVPPVLAHTVFAPSDRLDFLNATGAYAPDGTGGNDDSRGGLNNVDLWVGGLAEELMEFGGQLGSTFNFVFEYQMEHLQNGDRFYYLSRTQGMNLLNLLEPNTFADIIMRNTDLGDLHATHLSAEIMEVPDMILELDREVAQENYSGTDAITDMTDVGYDRSALDPTHEDDFQQAFDPKVLRIEGTARMNGSTPVLDAAGKQIYDGGVLKFSGGEHVVLGGTEGNDTLIGDKGIDTLWGDGGDDYLNPGMESDQVFGGDGDDIIEDPFGEDFLRGEAGDDVIVNGAGLDLLFGGDGQDFIQAFTDTTEVFAGPGNDFVLGGTAPDVLLGNEGDDWIEGGEGFDGLSGENSELFFNSAIVGHDILNGQGNDTDYDAENGDDIMVQSAGIQRNNGMDGFDWAIHKGDAVGADSDLGIRPFETRQALILRDRFDSVEGLSGWNGDDILTGAAKLLIGEGFTDALTQDGVNRIHGMREFLGIAAQGSTPGTAVVLESDINAGGEVILGGDGSDTIRGNLGNDILDGDAWLNVRIAVHANKVATADPGPVLFSADSLTSIVTAGTGIPSAWVGKQLAALMRSGDINPGQLQAVREILNSDGSQVALSSTNQPGDIDVAMFSDIRANYTIEGGGADTNSDGFITVTHNVPVGGGGGGTIDDGIDKIRNFEILSFADGNIFLDPTISNSPAQGALSITVLNDLTPGANVGDTFTVGIANISDADGPAPLPISAFSFVWQFEATPGANDWQPVIDPVSGEQVIGVTFTPTPAFELDGLRLRAVGSFRDAEGIPEVVFSDPTDPLAAQVVATPTAGDDVLVGTNVGDVINALAGDDIVTAVGGNDIVIGGPGNDILDGGLGTDTAVFFGPIGNFTFVLNAEGVLEVVDAAAGEEDAIPNFENLVFIDSPTTLTDTQVAAIVAGDRPAGVAVETRSVATILAGVFINDDANGNPLTGSEFADTIFGNGGDDIIDGLGGDDLLVGGDGDDDIDSGGGNDIISGGNSTVGNTIRARLGDETFLIGLGETGSDTVRNDGGTERISVGATANVNIAAQTGSVVTAPGDIATLTAEDDGAGNLDVTVNTKTITITDHFNNPNNAVELINFNGSSFSGINLGADDYNLVAAAAGVTTLNGSAGNDALFGTDAADTLSGGGGNDLVLAGTGDDTINWSVGHGRDIVHGGLEGATGDTFVVNGVAQQEFFRIYSRVEAVADGLTGLSPGTEIVITRTTAAGVPTNENIIAELAEIEEIVINTFGGGDNFAIIGSFDATNLFVNTITVNDGGGATTVDVTHLTSAHHVALHSSGNNDRIIGARPQDEVIPDGSGGDPDDEDEPGSANGAVRTGTPQADVLNGTAGDDTMVAFAGDDVAIGGAGADAITADEGADFINGGDGRDMIFAGAGDDQVFGGGQADIIYGDAGADRIFGDGGNDMITAGAGDDSVFGGAGDDLIVAGIGDGNDVYFGDDSIGGSGKDTLDMSAATVGVTVNLGSGPLANGSASSSQTGSDTLWGIENVNTGSGADFITASNAVNVMNGGGGSGSDTFRFLSASAADGDTILGFEPGDRIDLSAIDANIGTANDQSFTLVAPGALAAGQLAFSFETGAEGDFTRVQGGIDANAGADFELKIEGHHTLTAANVTL
jgi:Ca2+-binding RTX toxin-like protein